MATHLIHASTSKIGIISQFYKWGNWHSKRLNGWPIVLYQRSTRAQIFPGGGTLCRGGCRNPTVKAKLFLKKATLHVHTYLTTFISVPGLELVLFTITFYNRMEVLGLETGPMGNRCGWGAWWNTEPKISRAMENTVAKIKSSWAVTKEQREEEAGSAEIFPEVEGNFHCSGQSLLMTKSFPYPIGQILNMTI